MMLGWAISAAEATLAALLIAIGMGAAQRRVMTVLACVDGSRRCEGWSPARLAADDRGRAYSAGIGRSGSDCVLCGEVS